MKARLAVAALLLTSCATHFEVTGRYAATLSDEDVQGIRRLAATLHVGRAVITVDAVGRDRVHVEERRYDGEGRRGSGFFAVRRGSAWHVDERSEFTADRKFITY